METLLTIGLAFYLMEAYSKPNKSATKVLWLGFLTFCLIRLAGFSQAWVLLPVIITLLCCLYWILYWFYSKIIK